jgi:hypothetical protein
MANKTYILQFLNKKTGQAVEAKYCYSAASDSIIATTKFMHTDGMVEEGPHIKICLTPIRQAVFSKLNNTVGLSWGSIKRSAKRVASKVGKKKFLLQVKAIVEDPRFAKAMTAAGSVYPPLGITYAGVRVAASLVDKAAAKDPEALQKLAELKAMALDGDMSAAKAMRAVTMLYEMKKSSGVQISGWADDLYQGAIRSGFVTVDAPPERSNFLNKVRGFYRKGIIEASATTVTKD